MFCNFEKIFTNCSAEGEKIIFDFEKKPGYFSYIGFSDILTVKKVMKKKEKW